MPKAQSSNRRVMDEKEEEPFRKVLVNDSLQAEALQSRKLNQLKAIEE